LIEMLRSLWYLFGMDDYSLRINDIFFEYDERRI
jgi:hypothetical protein